MDLTVSRQIMNIKQSISKNERQFIILIVSKCFICFTINESIAHWKDVSFSTKLWDAKRLFFLIKYSAFMRTLLACSVVSLQVNRETVMSTLEPAKSYGSIPSQNTILLHNLLSISCNPLLSVPTYSPLLLHKEIVFKFRAECNMSQSAINHSCCHVYKPHFHCRQRGVKLYAPPSQTA